MDCQMNVYAYDEARGDLGVPGGSLVGPCLHRCNVPGVSEAHAPQAGLFDLASCHPAALVK